MTEATPEVDRSDGPEVDALRLPLLPLNTGVVLPQMVVTLTLESDEAKRAAAAAEAVNGRLVLVPRLDGKYAAVGTITQIESAGELPNGSRALVIRGVSRARIADQQLKRLLLAKDHFRRARQRKL